MNNEPLAWMDKKGNCVPDDVKQFEANNGDWFGGYTIPLYTHPAKTQSHTETAVKILNYLGYAQEPSKEEGADARRDKLVEIISQSHPAKTLTDEEIHQAIRRGFARDGFLSDGIFLEIKELLRNKQGVNSEQVPDFFFMENDLMGKR